LERAAELAGLLVSQAVGLLSGGAVVSPFVGYEREGKRAVVRCEGANQAEAITFGEAWLLENPAKADRAVLISEVRGEKPAVVAHAVELSAGSRAELKIAIPYRPHEHALLRAFFRGTELDREGASVWARTLLGQ
jgi:hypothetical protein